MDIIQKHASIRKAYETSPMKNALALLLTSKARAEILRLLFSEPPIRLHQRGIAKCTDVTTQAIQKEIQNLKKQDLIQESRDGNRVYYTANSFHPIYADLKSIVLKLVEPVSILKEVLQTDEIQIAFIFSATSKKEAKISSDVELLIIGNMGLNKVTSLLNDISDRLKRQIHPYVYTKKEYFNRIQSQDHFVTRLLRARREFIVGNECELEKLVKLQLVKQHQINPAVSDLFEMTEEDQELLKSFPAEESRLENSTLSEI
jgi:DNA-binding MarR family transcriptional regulator